MKRMLTLFCGFSILLIASVVVAQGQANDKFVKKSLKQYWTDKQGQPWNDLSCRMAVRLDPQYAQSLNATEISTDDGSLKYGGDWHYFSLKKDSVGTYADADYLVYENSSDPVTYQAELHKNGVPVILISSSKQEVRNDSVSKPMMLKNDNAMFLKDWLIIAGAILAGAILIYVIVFRWLFSGLLRRRWAVSSAEHFTWSLSLLGMLAIASALTLLYLGPRLETWSIMGIMGAFWLLHSIVWVVSGTKA